MNAAFANPGDRAWSLAWCAADDLIERANLTKAERALRERATHELAKSFLPAAALVVQTGGTRFEIVDHDAPEPFQDLYRQWSNDVVDACRRIP